MKIIAIGDPHFKIDNIEDVDIFIQKILILIQNENPNYIVVLGDLLHTHERIHTTPLNKAYEFIDKLKNICRTIVLVGNHDMISNQQFLTNNHWMNAMKKWDNVTIVDDIFEIKDKDYYFIFTPYVYPGRFIEALNLRIKNNEWQKATCIFAHQEFYGCKMGAIISSEGDLWDKNYPQIISGHIHEKQKLQNNIYYCGSALQHAFGENEINIIPILEWKDELNIREIDLELSRKKIIYSTINQLEDCKLPKDNLDKIKISISGNYEEFKSFKKTKTYRELIKNGTKIVFKPKKVEKLQNIENQKMNSVNEGDFLKILNTLILEERNQYLYQVYENIINNKNISLDDIFFI